MRVFEDYAGPVVFFGFVLVGVVLAFHGMRTKAEDVPSKD
jgi:hypothetical protein